MNHSSIQSLATRPNRVWPVMGFVAADDSAALLLGPGQWTVAEAPTVIETLLGSCVCITLWHPRTRIGAACHFVLPASRLAAAEGDPRYASEVLPAMLRALRDRGIEPRQCEAKLFGGGRMFETEGPDIGQRNIDQARHLLQALPVALRAEDVGGDGYRQIRFVLADGGVLSRFELARAIAPLSGGSA